jgi:HEPN domain-containing protein
MQTEWSAGWDNAPAGFSYAAEHLTEHAQEFGAILDQVGVPLFFLQRHRVELALKSLLATVGADVPPTHDLKTLWKKCEETLRPMDDKAWRTFETDHLNFIDLLDEVDPGSFAFRYPVDRQGDPIERPQFIDLGILHKCADSVYYGASGYADYLSDTYQGP